MSILQILKIVISIISMLFGVLGVLRPQALADFAHFGLSNPRSFAEMRINFGGLFIGLGAGAIVLNDPNVYLVLGLGYAGLAVVRFINLLFERSLREPIYLGTLGFEVISALILVAPIT